MFIQRFFRFILCALGVSVAGHAMAQAAPDPTGIPLLPPGHHISFETGFNLDNPRVVRQAIRRAQEDATEAGMRVKPLEIGWPEVEPTEGTYRLGEFEEALRDYERKGWRPLVFVRAIDSDDVTIPRYLKGTDDAISLSEIDVSSPEVIARYGELMNRVVPLVRRYNGFAIMVANEVDNFLGPNPELTPQVVEFVTAARDHIHGIDPEMAVGVALSNGFDYDDDGGRIRPPLPHHTALIDAGDIAVFNFYCQQVPISRQADSIRQRLDARIAAAKGKDVIIQELGCPSGGNEAFSFEHQGNFFGEYFEAVRGTPVRVSIVFQLVDWTEGTIEAYGNALKPIFETEPAFRENPNLIFVYLEQLGSIGMIDARTGEPKPAWFEFLDALENAE
jgi:hypothetical protein